jgi:hypothetical protein
MPTHAAPQYCVLGFPPAGALGVGTTKVPVAREIPLEINTAPAQLDEYESALVTCDVGAIGRLAGIMTPPAVRRVVVVPAAAARALRGEAETVVASRAAAVRAVERNFILTGGSRSVDELVGQEME